MGTVHSVLSPQAALTVVVAAGAIGLGYKQSTRPLGKDSSSTTDTTSSMAKEEGEKKKKKKHVQSNTQVVGPESPCAPASVMTRMHTVPGALDIAESQLAPTEPMPAPPSSSKSSKAKKKKKSKSATTATVAPTPPSQSANYDSDSSDGSHLLPPTAPSAATSSVAAPLVPQVPHVLETDGPWTRVESTRRKRAAAAPSISASASLSATNDAPSTELTTTTDPGIVTESSSPVAERTDDETFLLNSRTMASFHDPVPPVRPMEGKAERKLPKKSIKTPVDDMLETPDAFNPSLSRVMRVRPRPGERPVSGFSWGDYEDVSVGEGAGEGNDADGEDEGWDVVRRKRNKPERTLDENQMGTPAQVQVLKPDPATKRQRQNAKKRDVKKSAKAEEEVERLATLAEHKKGLEQERGKERVKEQLGKTGLGKVPSGGMKAVIDENGKLVWE